VTNRGFHDNDGHGILLLNANNNIVQGNTAKSNTRDGIHVGGRLRGIA